jgi:sulfur-oxidizing protein SoxY
MKRRTLLKGALAGGAVVAFGGAGLFAPRTVSAEWPTTAFQAASVNDVLAALGGGEVSAGGEIELKAPDIAENGAVVPVDVSSTLAGVTSIAILVEGNDRPLTSVWHFSGQAEPFVSVRLKMAKSSKLVALVQADGKSYKAEKEVKVTVGGCG